MQGASKGRILEEKGKGVADHTTGMNTAGGPCLTDVLHRSTRKYHVQPTKSHPSLGSSNAANPRSWVMGHNLITTRAIARSSRTGPGETAGETPPFWAAPINRRPHSMAETAASRQHRYIPRTRLHVFRNLHQLHFGTRDRASNDN